MPIDVVVVGLGAMGSAAVHALARSGAPSSIAAGAISSRTQFATASAMLQLSVAGGDSTTRDLSGRITASSFTMSGPPQPPGPLIGGSARMTARSGRLSWQAEGGGGVFASGSAGSAAGAYSSARSGFGRGNGMFSAAANPLAPTSTATMVIHRPSTTLCAATNAAILRTCDRNAAGW